jgi:hypothetical protein
MLYSKFKSLFKLFSLLVLLTPFDSALAKKTDTSAIIKFLPSSSIEIKGDSTVRKFSAKAEKIELKGTAEMQPLADGFLNWTPTEIEMRIETENLKSDGRTLDEHMHEAMKIKQYTSLIMKLNTFSFEGKNKEGAEMVTSRGSFTLAGVTQTIEIKALLRLEGSQVRIQGHKEMLMSDYGIAPPTMMLGTLKTKDAIDVNFDVIGQLNE